MTKWSRLAVAVFFYSLAASASAETLHVYNWNDYIDEALLEKFEQQTGIRLVYDVFDSNEILETRLLAGGSGYDVVVPSGAFLQRQIAAGVFQPLDPDLLPNSRHLWDLVKTRTAQFDPGNVYSVNYMWGTTGIGVNLAKVKEILGPQAPVDSLSLIFDPRYAGPLARCGIFMLDAPDEMIPAALTYLGEDGNSKDIRTIEKTESLFEAIRPFVRKFDNSGYISALANGDICVAFGYSGDILQARDRALEAENGVEIAYHAPREGAVMWFDQMAIPADAPNRDAAHRFMNFMMDPHNMAQASNYVFYANGNATARQYMDPEILDDPAIYPDEETLASLYIVTTWPPHVQRAASRLWTRIKSGL